MPKGEKIDPEEKARKRIVKAQAALQQAQEYRARVKLEGEQAVDRARQQAEARLNRATLRVEKEARALEQAQHRLEELRGTAPGSRLSPTLVEVRAVRPAERVGER